MFSWVNGRDTRKPQYAIMASHRVQEYYACSDISDELYNEWLSKVGETKASAFCKTDSTPSYWVINKGKLQNDRDEFMRQLRNDSSRHNNGDASLTLT